jgi:hypothetical protein
MTSLKLTTAIFWSAANAAALDNIAPDANVVSAIDLNNFFNVFSCLINGLYISFTLNLGFNLC